MLRRFLPFPAVAALALSASEPLFASSYSLVSAVYSVSTAESVIVGQTADGSNISRTNSGSQALMPDWNWDYKSMSSATIGVLHGYAFIDSYCNNEPYCSNTPISSQSCYHAVTQSSYGDTITVSSATQNGQSGIANFYFTVDGSTIVTQLGALTDVYGQMTVRLRGLPDAYR